jgi:hypothetical protein
MKKKMNELPIAQKAKELIDLVQAFNTTIPEDDDYLKTIGQLMAENSMIILAKIAGAEGGNLYSNRMQNAAIIRQAGLDLYVQIGGLRFVENFSQPEYIDLIRSEIDAFRELFKEWIYSFDTRNAIPDEWGLFNAPISLFNQTNVDDIDWDAEDDEDEDWLNEDDDDF